MPVKKDNSKKKKDSQKKPNKRKKSSKKTTGKKKSEVKKNIAKAIDQIPSAFAEEISANKDKALKELRPKETTKLEMPKVYESNTEINERSRKRLMWFGVISLTLVVFVMWFWNAKTIFYDIRNSKAGDEKQIWENTKSDFKTIINDFGTGEDSLTEELESTAPPEEVTDALKDTLKILLTNTTSTTKEKTSVTSTQEIVTTSTKNIE